MLLVLGHIQLFVLLLVYFQLKMRSLVDDFWNCSIFNCFSPSRLLFSTITPQHRVSQSCGLAIRSLLPGQTPPIPTSLYR